jgi:hypothetical protein
MSLRDAVRRLRLYYKSRSLFEQALADPGVTRWLPFRRGDARAEIRWKDGGAWTMRARHWSHLPSACRLHAAGLEFEFLDEAKRVRMDGLTLYSPLWAREEAIFYRETLRDDVYGVKGSELSGATVIDVGAYVGDSTIAFAREGATVHACEPSAAFCGFIRRNLDANALSERVTLHAVGLAERTQTKQTANDTLHFVEGVGYAIGHLPREAELLKLDCEGSEYHLLADPRFLEHLRPRRIRMEYHRGPEPLVAHLERDGYRVELAPATGPVGLLAATRKGAA